MCAFARRKSVDDPSLSFLIFTIPLSGSQSHGLAMHPRFFSPAKFRGKRPKVRLAVRYRETSRGDDELACCKHRQGSNERNFTSDVNRSASKKSQNGAEENPALQRKCEKRLKTRTTYQLRTPISGRHL